MEVFVIVDIDDYEVKEVFSSFENVQKYFNEREYMRCYENEKGEELEIDFTELDFKELVTFLENYHYYLLIQKMTVV